MALLLISDVSFDNQVQVMLLGSVDENVDLPPILSCSFSLWYERRGMVYKIKRLLFILQRSNQSTTSSIIESE